MSDPLIVSERLLTAHLGRLEAILTSDIDTSPRATLAANWSLVPLVVGLVGEGCEVTSRNRGPDVRVAPLLLLENGLWAWLGYREEWEGEKPAGRVRRYSFRSAGLTVHFGYRYNRHKPQIFRAEWAGWARWNGSDYGYQAGNAAHPHWQFDALESLKRDDADDRAMTFLSVLKREAKNIKPHEFSPQSMGRDEIGELVGAQELSRIHFASAAAWWKTAPDDAHAHAPASPTDIETWVQETVQYTLRELSRLQGA